MLNLQAKLAPRWRNSQSAAYVANLVNINKIRGVDQYGGGAFWANMAGATPGTLLGQRSGVHVDHRLDRHRRHHGLRRVRVRRLVTVPGH